MRNVELFNKYAGELFVKLYEVFPQEVTLRLDIEEFPDDEAMNIYYYTVKFLAREGFITYEKEGVGPFFQGVVLTPKGLKALKKIPSSLQEEKPIISAIKSALKEGSKVLLGKLIEELL
jgi:DNA-binding PadR family transcriptional regulator